MSLVLGLPQLSSYLLIGVFSRARHMLDEMLERATESITENRLDRLQFTLQDAAFFRTLHMRIASCTRLLLYTYTYVK